ncbi:c-type heme family protein [Rubripirellula reticaptiva]|uniref:Tll0287-like domain-containing protein n=1 Tax=Rubripirellula reticaptiva TaxID=2528013 RepID=A0A5C6EH56_9BACT|nr:DUF3365 domain-containing protein [Rubripirellula reticaptiva]TWU47051.1 hypothetical protein Poly59_60250 [Rubripirellula reticaptiva]
MIQTHFRTQFSITAMLVGLIVGGCSSSDNSTVAIDVSNPEVAIADGEEPTQDQIDRMLKAKEALFTQLSGRLMETMGAQGPVAAISVCQKEAPKIASDVGSEQGLKIGRTGVRLRNPDNAAPAWATALTDAKTDTAHFVSLTNGHAAALLPIKLQGQCLMCHGPTSQISPVIQEQLAKLYPNDQATGFKEGELRGWFWVELPNG